MEKYFSSTYQSGIAPNKSFSSFNSMIAFPTKPKPKQTANTDKGISQRSFNKKSFTFKKEMNKTAHFIPSSDRQIFKSAEKKPGVISSSKNIVSEWKPKNNNFMRKKQLHSFREISIPEKKELRESDSTLCQSPKGYLNFGLKISDFKKLRLIGNGKYGSVFMVKYAFFFYFSRHIKTGFVAAMKVIRKIDIDCLEKKQKEQMINQLIREIKIQMYLNHPNLVKLYTYFSDDYNIYLLMELGCDGQLYDLMKKKHRFSEETVAIISRQISQGLSYMHKNRVIHRDLKPENIVLIHGFAKICDFGWSVFCSKELRSTFCGTPLYLSPQILKGNLYNQKIDTWAIGTLAYQLYTADNPFKIKKKQDLAKIITQDFVMKTGSLELREFITFILKKDPNKRPDAQAIRHHKFIERFRDLDTSEQICSLVYKQQPSVYQSYSK